MAEGMQGGIAGAMGAAAAGAGAAAAGMGEVVAAAEAGRFSVSPQAADHLIRVLQNLQDGLIGQRNDLGLTAQETPLGTSPIGLAIGHKNARMGAGDPDSLQARHAELEAMVPQLIEALQKATANYRASDEDGAAGITGTRG